MVSRLPFPPRREFAPVQPARVVVLRRRRTCNWGYLPNRPLSLRAPLPSTVTTRCPDRSNSRTLECLPRTCRPQVPSLVWIQVRWVLRCTKMCWALRCPKVPLWVSPCMRPLRALAAICLPVSRLLLRLRGSIPWLVLLVCPYHYHTF